MWILTLHKIRVEYKNHKNWVYSGEQENKMHDVAAFCADIFQSKTFNNRSHDCLDDKVHCGNRNRN